MIEKPLVTKIPRHFDGVTRSDISDYVKATVVLCNVLASGYRQPLIIARKGVSLTRDAAKATKNI